MHRNPDRQVVLGVAAAALFAAACQSSSAPPKPPEPKSVVLITMDGLRQDHLSTFGYFRPTAPNLNWLSVNGLAIRNVIATSCSAPPSLAALHTGTSISKLADGKTLSDASVTLAEIFAQAGYRTAAFVASPDLARANNFDQGFEVYEDFDVASGKYVTADVPINAAIEHLRASGDDKRPLFLYVHMREPHPPWKHASEWAGNEESETFFDKDCDYLPSGDELAFVDDHEKKDLIAKYDGALRFADDQMGLLFGEIRTMGNIKKTVIAVTSPHGIELLDRYSGTHAYNPFDEVLRQVLLLLDESASFKDAIAPSLQARIFDVAPTLLQRAALAVPENMDGVDLLATTPDIPEFAFSHCANADVVRSLEYKLIDFDFAELRRQKQTLPVGIREGQQLFALRADPEEKIDVAGSRADELEQMQAALERYRKSFQGIEK